MRGLSVFQVRPDQPAARASVVAEVSSGGLLFSLFLLFRQAGLPLRFAQAMAAITVIPSSTSATADIGRICLYSHARLP